MRMDVTATAFVRKLDRLARNAQAQNCCHALLFSTRS